MVDLTKLQSTTTNQGFKNNDEYSGSFVISGTFNGQSKIITKTIELPSGTDLPDIIFKGRADGGFSIPTSDPRDNAAWFKRGSVWVRVDSNDGSGYSNYPQPFRINASVSGTTLTISAESNKQYIAGLDITSETVYYKIVDYSVY